MESGISGGRLVVAYIKNIETTLYARHAFPLPRLGKVTSNIVEQANPGFLAIHEFASFKLLVEMWYYLQAKFNNRREEAKAREEVLTLPAYQSHMANLYEFGQWQVLDDGSTQAKVQTIDQRHEYLVDVTRTPRCTCYELQEMIWPCQHIMVWDDRDGKDFMQHFP